MDIGIIGSGNIGGTLARHLAVLGHRVSVANSCGPASLAALAAETGATAATAAEAARDLSVQNAPLEQRAGLSVSALHVRRAPLDPEGEMTTLSPAFANARRAPAPVGKRQGSYG